MLPVETLRQILLQLSRDDLDAVELVNRHLRSIILSDTFVKWGPLRSFDSLRVISPHKIVIERGKRDREFPTNAALVKDTFVSRVYVNGKKEDSLRWFLAVVPRMRIVHLDMHVPEITNDFQEQLFSVLACRRTIVTLDGLSLSLGGSTTAAVLPEDVVAFLFSEKRNDDSDAPSDVVVGLIILRRTAATIDPSTSMSDTLAKVSKAVSATDACPPFFLRIAGAALEAHELPQLRHLNRATGQHFVVDSDWGSGTSVKCITVMRPRD